MMDLEKGINVLSLFDGISCGQLALERAGIKVNNYYASEIDKHAIKVTQHNYPNTIQLGSVVDLKGSDLQDIDLIIGGSPCTSFSSSGTRTGFDGKSGLFWEYNRILHEVKPKYFLLENVVMKTEWENIISDAVGVDPILINSSLVSAQHRSRLYWTNIPNVEQPIDKGINLIDILDLEDEKNPAAIRGRYINKATIVGRRISENGTRDDYNKNVPITQCLEVRATNQNKSNCITTVAKDNVLTSLPVGRHIDAYKRKLPFRNYSVNELCRLQTVPTDYFNSIISDNQIRKTLGNGWTVDVIAHILSFIK